MSDSGAEKVANAVLGVGKCPKINRTKDIPYLAGYSNDGKTIFIDKHMPKTIDVLGHKIDPEPFLRIHEETEKGIEDRTGSKYLPAHEKATQAEHRALGQHLLRLGVPPGQIDRHVAAYEKALAPHIKADEDEGVRDAPKNLDEQPYKNEHDKPVLGRLARAGVH
jgi:hypothetical protein